MMRDNYLYYDTGAPIYYETSDMLREVSYLISELLFIYRTSDMIQEGVLFDIGAPIYISDLRYDIGGVLFDIGAPIYISDLRYDIEGVLFDIGAPIYISDLRYDIGRCPI